MHILPNDIRMYFCGIHEKILAHDYRIVKEQLHKNMQRSRPALLCFENHVQVRLIKTVALQKPKLHLKNLYVSPFKTDHFNWFSQWQCQRRNVIQPLVFIIGSTSVLISEA